MSCPSYSADLWASGKVFAVADQTLNPNDGRYYQCIGAHTAGATFDATKFGILTPFVRSIDYEQAGKTPLGEVRFIWDRNPETNRYAQKMMFRLRPDFVQVQGTANVVWVEFRRRPNVYTTVLWSASATYTAGATIYDPATGDCWTANTTTTAGENPTSAPAKWDKVEFPYLFAEYTALSAYASLVNREEQAEANGPENFSLQLAAGYPLLQLELDKIERQQGQVRQLNVRTGRGSMGGWWYRS